MSARLPKLMQLRCFETAARHESFTAAAEELGMTQSAISKKIRELETDLGFDLFLRVGRGVVLTAAGRNFADRLASDLNGLRKTVQEAVAAGARKTALSIGILPTFANLWLIPRLPDFFARHPEIELSFSTRLVPFDFDHEPVDLAFHYGRENWPGTQMLHLFGEKVVPVCSPEFRYAHGMENDPGNLSQAPLLHLTSRPRAWSDWIEKAGIHKTSPLEGRYFDQHSMVISAAIASLGAAIVPVQMVARELSSGELVRLDDTEMTTGKSYYLVRQAGPASPPIVAFETWVRKQSARQ
ncbi:LysR substrate-binding domain-containing protein [Alisedimentitalea sp. MJ-SS2]|uniref:LysR substrate-binding domain-containing protein n=1 Tax=Aliisedimentitalea sp. MJ-SS2 TaxID=3049795 RepID=UPI0029112870|nr:LysR substrate-binding domain-containing protein [Alisedimentitalea sp. MJ-SS2]MDU8926167.1 LysR substrate-binding domain-containing protein [Alisedimentitalea sp. MJ-SS2]